MATVLKWPLTNQELSEVLDENGQYRFAASLSEYWGLLSEVPYRVDFIDNQIIASISYESDLHSHLAAELGFFLKTVFSNNKQYRVYNSNRPVFVEDCKGLGTGIFNADGMVTTLPAQRYEYQKGMSAEMNPMVVIEILSTSTRAYDFATKLPCYKSTSTLQTILFVERDQPKIFFSERVATNQWLETVLTKADDTIVIDGKMLSLSELYREVYF